MKFRTALGSSGFAILISMIMMILAYTETVDTSVITFILLNTALLVLVLTASGLAILQGIPDMGDYATRLRIQGGTALVIAFFLTVILFIPQLLITVLVVIFIISLLTSITLPVDSKLHRDIKIAFLGVTLFPLVAVFLLNIVDNLVSQRLYVEEIDLLPQLGIYFAIEFGIIAWGLTKIMEYRVQLSSIGKNTSADQVDTEKVAWPKETK